MTVNIKALVGLFIIQFLSFALPLFLAAGTLAWPAGWIFLALSFGFGLTLTLWLFRYNPDLLKERMTIVRSDQKAWDKVRATAIALPMPRLEAKVVIISISLAFVLTRDVKFISWERAVYKR